jgi:hypothetical protein
MRLYADFALLSSGSGTCAAAYGLLRQAGYEPQVSYVPRRQRDGELLRLTGHTEPPVLVTDEGSIVASLPGIIDWLASATQ